MLKSQEEQLDLHQRLQEEGVSFSVSAEADLANVFQIADSSCKSDHSDNTCGQGHTKN